MFLVFSLVLYFSSRYNDAPYLAIVSSGIIFLLGATLLLGGVEYSTGFDKTVSYSINYSDSSTPIVNYSSNITAEYSPLVTNIVQGIDVLHFFGFLMVVIGMIVFISSMQDLGKLRGKDE